jgi:hypothetical protein
MRPLRLRLTGNHAAAAVMILAAIVAVAFGGSALETIGLIVLILVVMVVLTDLISPGANLLRSRGWFWWGRGR